MSTCGLSVRSLSLGRSRGQTEMPQGRDRASSRGLGNKGSIWEDQPQEGRLGAAAQGWVTRGRKGRGEVGGQQDWAAGHR